MTQPVPFTHAQVRSMYEMIESGNAEFLTMVARAAIGAATEVKTDMWNEMEPNDQKRCLFDGNDVKAQAHDYVNDTFGEFVTELKKRINSMQVTLDLTIKTEVKCG